MAELLKRCEVPLEMQWDLSVLYASDEAYEEDFKKLPDLVDKVTSFKGKLTESPLMLKEGIEAVDELTRLAEKLYTYAHLKSDEDTSNNLNKSRLNKMAGYFAEVSGATAFFEPEILACDEEKLNELINSEELSFYKRSLLELLREKAHTLSEKEERILGLYSDVMSSSDEIFSVLNDADMSFGLIRDGNGKNVEMSHGNYRIFMESSDRKLRERAFKKMFSTYNKYRNTFAATLDGTAKRHSITAKLRNYSSSLAASLADDNVSEDVYLNLIKTVKKGVPYLSRYLKLRKKVMKLKSLNMYDLYNPLVKNVKAEYSWEEAKDLVKKALAPLGEDYVKLLDRAFEERWVDVLENKGKRSGAYSSGCYDSYPYLLLNFNGTLNDVFTLAHELGHSMHSYYSIANQEFHYASYSIFVAEVASITNELLLFNYLLENSDNQELRAYLLGQLLDEIRATLYRQTMFAEFELEFHKLAEQNTPLSGDLLSEIYFKINKDYYGEVISEPNQLIEMEWARIPHFYYNFYVYKYATGMAAAIQLSRNILSGDKKKIDAYFGFLKAGDSKDVLDIMLDAGVDLSSPAPIEAALEYFNATVIELEKLLA